MTPQQLTLFSAHQHLPARIARRWPSQFGILSRDDLVSVGAIGLLEAATRHDGSSGFASYARRRIRYAIIDEIRELAQPKRVRNGEFPDFEFVQCDKLEQEASQERIVNEQEEWCLLQCALRELPQRTRVCIEMHINGVMQTTIAAQLGVSPARVLQILKQGIDELKRRVHE